MDDDVAGRTEWTVLRVDPLTGDLITSDEAAFREKIREEASHGKVGIDSLYAEVHHAIHQPLVDEHGQITDDSWQLQRANQAMLRVPIGNTDDPAALEDAAVTIARSAIDDFAAEVMVHLFTIANDPPNWRRPDFTIRLSDLLDKLNFKRDARGVHRSDARRRLSSTLLALHLTHIGLQRNAKRRGGRTVGFIAPLLASVGYQTREDVSHLSPIDVFGQGLPEEVSIVINPLWYGMRQADGLPGKGYTLIPRPEARSAETSRPRGGKRSRTADLLREYIMRCRSATTDTNVLVSRKALLEIGAMTDRRAGQATQTLTKALDTLCADHTLAGYAPNPLPLGNMDLITLTWIEDA